MLLETGYYRDYDVYANSSTNTRIYADGETVAVVSESTPSQEYNKQTPKLSISNTRAVCKVTDASGNLLYIDGKPALYASLEEAFEDMAATKKTGEEKKTFTSGRNSTDAVTPAKVMMLVPEYTSSAPLTVPDLDVTLTTASATDADYPFAGPDPSQPAVITRGTGNTGSLFTVNSAQTTFTLTDVTLDGGATFTDGVYSSGAVDTNGGIINASAGAVILSDHATLRNSAAKNGGGVYTSGSASLTIDGTDALITSCAAIEESGGGKGGGIYAGGSVNYSAGTLSGNSAANGSAVYVDGSTLNMTGGEITANRVDGDTGAVEVGGAAPKLNFSGDAKVYGNIYEENQVAQQRNVSLSTDPTGVIQAGTSADGNTVTGLGEGAHIGVYLTDSVFQEHGLSAQNFATSLPSATDHLSAFGNDRDRVLYGEEGENGNVKWTSYACKLTDGNGNLLYKADGSPAVYKTMEEALEALEAERSTDPGQADKSLYTTPNAGQGSAYAYDADGTNNPPVQIQMLSDYTVPAGGLLIDANRPVTIATASNHSPDGYSYHKKDENSDENRATFKLSDQTTATAPMITFATGNPVTVENIVMDGNKGGGASSTSEEGGAVKITNPPGAENPTTASFTNVQIKDISSTGKGAAVYVDDQSTLTIEGGSITGNETTDERGGAINVGSDVEKDSEGYITSVNSHGTVELKGDVEIKDNGPAVQDPTTHQTTVPQQKNIVLDVPSTEVIQTVDQGLGENAQVGVYVTNTPVINSDGDKSTVYKEYGTYNTSFSTLSTNENHAGNLSNDRNENLTGEKNSTKGEWTDLVCKLTDAEGNLLFTGPSFQEPAVFGSIKAALDAADPDAVKPLYKATKNGDEWIFTPLDTGDETPPVQIQLLQDTSLTEPITYTEVRDLTFATAPSKINAEPDQITAMDELGDVYFYTPGQGSDPDRAKITNGQTEQSSAGGAAGVESMITVNAPDATVKIKGLILDGNEKTTLGNGGAINLASGSMEVEGSVLQNFTVQGDGLAPGTGDGGKGGAIYVGSGNASGNTHDEPTLTLKDTVITGNEAVAGGGIFIEQGSGSKNPTVTLENALVVANKADGAHKIGTATDSLSGNGGGIYVSPGAVLNMENTEKPSTVAGNSSTGDGAGVYLAGAAEAGSAGARVNLGGKPDFGGTDVYTVTNGTESTSYLIQTRMNDSGRITQFYEDSAGVKHYVAMATDPTKNEVTDLGTDEEDAVYYTIKIDSQGRISKYDEDGNPLEQSGDKTIWYEKNPADGKYYRVTVNADGISQPLASDEGKAAAIRPILANYKSDLSAGTTNGGAYYPQERQDLFVEGFANPADDSGNVTGETPATSIVITKPLSAQAGSIWVWGEETEHSQMLTQFAVFDDALLAKDDSGAVTGFDTSKISAQELAATLAAMRNARDDTSSDCGGEYLTGSTGDNPKYMYWTGGFDVRFVKRDGYGRELSGARFSLYKTYTPAQTPEGEATLSDPYQRNAAKVEISSSAGEEVEDPETHQRILKDKGLVLFEKVPTGIWYLKEDTAVEVKTNGAAGDLEGANEILWKSESIYVVLVGSKTMEITTGTGNVRTGLWAAGALLENILEEDITKQTGTGEDKADFAIFLLSSGGKAIPSIDRAELNATGISQARADLFGLAPDVKTYGIMNQAEKTAPVLAGKTDETLSPLSGGTFTIRRADRTVVEEDLVSTASGVYYVGRLPYGTYLVEETGAPSGYQLPGNYFVLQVTPEGIKNESSLNTRVVAESTQTTVYAKP